MWKKFVLNVLLIILIQCRFIESFVEVMEINKLSKKENLDELGAIHPIQLSSYNKNNIIRDPIHMYLDALINEKRGRWQDEKINDRFRRSLEDEENVNRHARQNDNDLNDSNNNGVESFQESESLLTPKFNVSTNLTGASSIETMSSIINDSYLPPPTGNPWKPETSSYYPHQSSAGNYYPQPSICVCQPVYHRPPPPSFSYYQPPELTADAYFGHSYETPTQGQHLPIFKPFPFYHEHSIYPGSSYFKPSHPDEYHGSYEAPKHSYNPLHKNFFKKK